MRLLALLLLLALPAGAATLDISWQAEPGHESVLYVFTNSVMISTPLTNWFYRQHVGTNVNVRARVYPGWWLFLVTSITTNGVESMPAIPLYYVNP